MARHCMTMHAYTHKRTRVQPASIWLNREKFRARTYYLPFFFFFCVFEQLPLSVHRPLMQSESQKIKRGTVANYSAGMQKQ